MCLVLLYFPAFPPAYFKDIPGLHKLCHPTGNDSLRKHCLCFSQTALQSGLMHKEIRKVMYVQHSENEKSAESAIR